MKHSMIIIAFFIFCFQEVNANKIDSLHTDNQVENFITSLYKKGHKSFSCIFRIKKPDSINSLIPCDSTIIRESEKWKKIDFNKDGLTDLFVIVYKIDPQSSDFSQYIPYVVIDHGNTNFELIAIPDYFQLNCFSVKPILVNSVPCLLYRHYKTYAEEKVDSLNRLDTLADGTTMSHTITNYFNVAKIDTLIYKFGGFIELNKLNKKVSEIKSIYRIRYIVHKVNIRFALD